MSAVVNSWLSQPKMALKCGVGWSAHKGHVVKVHIWISASVEPSYENSPIGSLPILIPLLSIRASNSYSTKHVAFGTVALVQSYAGD